MHFGQWPDGLHGYLVASAKTAFGFYQGFLAFATSHYQLFAWLVPLGELCVGVALVFGILSRFAALTSWLRAGPTDRKSVV